MIPVSVEPAGYFLLGHVVEKLLLFYLSSFKVAVSLSGQFDPFQSNSSSSILEITNYLKFLAYRCFRNLCICPNRLVH